MTNSQLYNAIFRRRSIRKYDMSPLPADTIEKLREYDLAIYRHSP